MLQEVRAVPQETQTMEIPIRVSIAGVGGDQSRLINRNEEHIKTLLESKRLRGRTGMFEDQQLQAQAPDYCFTPSGVDAIVQDKEYVMLLQASEMNLPAAGDKFTLEWFNWFAKNTAADFKEIIVDLLTNEFIELDAEAGAKVKHKNQGIETRMGLTEAAKVEEKRVQEQR